MSKPTETHRWQCHCGASGWYNPIDLSLAGLVLAARTMHETIDPCPDPDIVQVQTRAEYERHQQDTRVAKAGYF